MRRAGLIVLFVLLVVGVAAGPGEAKLNAGDDLDIVVISVDYGDAILVEFPTGVRMLVDGGASEGSTLADGHHGLNANKLLKFLKGVYYNESPIRLDAVLLTHTDADHLRGVNSVLNCPEIAVGQVYHYGITHSLEYVGSYAHCTPDSNTVFGRFVGYLQSWLTTHPHGEHWVHRGMYLTNSLSNGAGLGGVTVKVRHPKGKGVTSYSGNTSKTNAHSVVLHIRWKDFDALLAADANEASEIEMVKEYGKYLRADLLKVPHHGSDDFYPRFFELVDPTVAIVPCAYSKSSEHPYKGCVAKLRECMAPLPAAQAPYGQILAVGKERVPRGDQAQMDYLNRTVYACCSATGEIKVWDDKNEGGKPLISCMSR